jgi:methionyl aminopeptidase
MVVERRVTLKSRGQIEKMAQAGRIVADVLDRLAEEIRPGITTIDLDALAESFIRAAGATPSFIGVPGRLAPYRHATCISIDEGVVHGIPDRRRVEEGQLVSVDVGAIVEGWHGDGARTFIVGDVAERTRRLVQTTRQAMFAGIDAAVPGAFLDDISQAIERFAIREGYGIVRSFVGHGIGSEMHEEPQVANFSTGQRGRRLEPGLCLAIEPMFTLGGHEVEVLPDGWTVVTADGSLAAHWEHSIAVTESGPRILTTNEAGERLPAAVGL